MQRIVNRINILPWHRSSSSPCFPYSIHTWAEEDYRSSEGYKIYILLSRPILCILNKHKLPLVYLRTLSPKHYSLFRPKLKHFDHYDFYVLIDCEFLAQDIEISNWFFQSGEMLKLLFYGFIFENWEGKTGCILINHFQWQTVEIDGLVHTAGKICIYFLKAQAEV